MVPQAKLRVVVVGHLVDPGSGLIRLSKCGDLLSLDNKSNGYKDQVMTGGLKGTDGYEDTRMMTAFKVASYRTL